MCCPERFSDWLGEDSEWLSDSGIKAIAFIDENIHHINKEAVKDMDDSIKLLSFPRSLDGCSDRIVLSSVICFIKANKILITRSMSFFFVTMDMGFERRSDSEKQHRDLDFEVRFLFFKFEKSKKKNHKNLSKRVVQRINEEIDRIQKWEDNMTLPLPHQTRNSM